MENYVGKRLDGRYEVQEIIGVGGMSVVYKAYDNVDDRIVAIKILKDEFSDDEEFVRRFKNESKAIAVLSHPNIVKVYDVSFGEKIQYIVMEYVDGITLKEYIQKQHIITWNDAVFFTTQILKALQHAHDKGIVHRDIKPQNIILLPTGNIKVTDFGIARFSRTQTKTLTENAIGSVHYISPEQAKGEFTDERDGQVYKTIQIGEQIWMAQNLNYAYTGIKFNFSGGKSDSTSWCYKNDLDNCGIYGRLYTWSAAMDSAGLVSDANKIGCGFGVPCIPNNPHRGICPVGWHLPDTTELTVLLNYAGGGIVAQNVLKSKSGWNGTDDLGFSLLPAGTGVYSYLFDHLKQYTEIWSVTEADGDHDERAWILKIDYSDLQRSLFNNKKSYHLSVRCLKDSD